MITDEMKEAAEAFKSAAIEAGAEYATVGYEAEGWSTDGEGLRVFCVDGKEHKSRVWEERK